MEWQKSHRLLLAVAGILISLFPLTFYLLWVYTASQFPSHQESVAHFNSYFPAPFNQPLISTLLFFSFAVLAIFLLLRALPAFSGAWRFLLYAFLILTSLLAFLLFFSLL